MTSVYIPVRYVRSMDPETGRIGIEAEMTEAQMLEALESFLTRISGETWAAWVDKINAEVAA